MQGVHIRDVIGDVIGSADQKLRSDRHLFVANKVRKFPKEAISRRFHLETERRHDP